MHMMYGYGSFWSMILMIIFWSGLISLGIYLITNFINGGNKKSSLQIIKKRLANGEIDETEYLRLKSIIERDRKE
ncbi:MAG TPA: SHOCT domain-containing protein [Pseudogracilibacillus sp.]|nr:SHOCT domain-containing protein [Pseudogracilibacillus sp.]